MRLVIRKLVDMKEAFDAPLLNMKKITKTKKQKTKFCLTSLSVPISFSTAAMNFFK